MSKKQTTLFQTWNKVASPEVSDRNLFGTHRNVSTPLQLVPSTSTSTSSPNLFQTPKHSKKADELEYPNFDFEAGKTWIYPTNYPVRDYQFAMVKEALFKNTLVVLPTGLGKTFIAAVVMYNIYRWFPNGKVVFMAPTKPLVAQQVDACFNITGIPLEDTTQMTGTNAPELRKKMWQKKRVFFLTPQVLVNDLVRNICPAANIKCLVVDEAHKALGNHAYCQVIKELSMYTSHFRVLALTATPGSETQAVKHVMTNLLISHVEMRSEDSEDVLQYTHVRDIEKIVVPLGDRISDLKSRFLDVINVYLKRLTHRKVMTTRNPASLSKFQVLKLREAFCQHPPGSIDRASYGIAMADLSLLISLYHAYELLLLHGVTSFYNFLLGILNGDKSIPHARSELLKNFEFEEIMRDIKNTYIPDPPEPNMVNNEQSTFQKKKVLPGHPKLEKLLEVVLQHFRLAQKDNFTDTRVMIFTQYRDSVQEIVDMLNQHQPTIKVMSFVGQSSKSGSNVGFSQKQQLKVIQQFRSGGYNTLVSTCVGEEGLDIGEVDLIVCYDCPKSPIRLVQRMGRTGRLRKGRIVILIAEGKEEQMYNTCEYRKKRVHNAITKGFSFAQFYQNSPSLLPPGVKPECVKTVVTIERRKEEPKVKVISKSPFLNEDEMAEFNKHVKMPLKDAPLLPVKQCIVLQKQEPVISKSAVQPQLSLHEWTLWQTTPQRTDMIPHSSKSLLLVKTLEYINFPELLPFKSVITEPDFAVFLNNSSNHPKRNDHFSSFLKQSKITDCLSASNIVAADDEDIIEIFPSPKKEKFNIPCVSSKQIGASSNNLPLIERLCNINVPCILKKVNKNNMIMPPPVVKVFNLEDFSNVVIGNAVIDSSKKSSVLHLLNKKIKAKLKRKKKELDSISFCGNLSINYPKVTLPNGIKLNKPASTSFGNSSDASAKVNSEQLKTTPENVFFDIDFDIPDTFSDNFFHNDDYNLPDTTLIKKHTLQKNEKGSDSKSFNDNLKLANLEYRKDFNFENSTPEKQPVEKENCKSINFDIDFFEDAEPSNRNEELFKFQNQIPPDLQDRLSPDVIIIDEYPRPTKFDNAEHETGKGLPNFQTAVANSGNLSSYQLPEKELPNSINFDIDFFEIEESPELEETSVNSFPDNLSTKTKVVDELGTKSICSQNFTDILRTNCKDMEIESSNNCNEEKLTTVLKDVKNTCHALNNEMNVGLKSYSFLKDIPVENIDNKTWKNIPSIISPKKFLSENLIDNSNTSSNAKDIDKLDGSGETKHIKHDGLVNDSSITVLYNVSNVLNNSSKNSNKSKLSLKDKTNKILNSGDEKFINKNLDISLDSKSTNILLQTGVNEICAKKQNSEKTKSNSEECNFNLSISFGNNSNTNDNLKTVCDSSARGCNMSSESAKVDHLSKNDFIDDLDEFHKDANSVLEQLFSSQKNVSADMNSTSSPLTVKRCISETGEKGKSKRRKKLCRMLNNSHNHPTNHHVISEDEKLNDSDLFKVPAVKSDSFVSKVINVPKINLNTNKNPDSSKSNLNKTVVEEASQYTLTQLLSLINSSESIHRSNLEKSYIKSPKHFQTISDTSSEDEVCPTPPKNIVKPNSEFIYTKKCDAKKSLDFGKSNYDNFEKSNKPSSLQHMSDITLNHVILPASKSKFPENGVGIHASQEKVKESYSFNDSDAKSGCKSIACDNVTDSVLVLEKETNDKNEIIECKSSPKITFDVSFDLPFTQDEFERSVKDDMNNAILISSFSSEDKLTPSQNNDILDFFDVQWDKNQKVDSLHFPTATNSKNKELLSALPNENIKVTEELQDSESLLPAKLTGNFKLLESPVKISKSMVPNKSHSEASNLKLIKDIESISKPKIKEIGNCWKDSTNKDNLCTNVENFESDDFESNILFKHSQSKTLTTKVIHFPESDAKKKEKKLNLKPNSNQKFLHKDKKGIQESKISISGINFPSTVKHNSCVQIPPVNSETDNFKNAKSILEEKYNSHSTVDVNFQNIPVHDNNHINRNTTSENFTEEKLCFDITFDDETCDLLPKSNLPNCTIKENSVNLDESRSNLLTDSTSKEFKNISKKSIFKTTVIGNNSLNGTVSAKKTNDVSKLNSVNDELMWEFSLYEEDQNFMTELQKNNHSLISNDQEKTIQKASDNSSDEFDHNQNQTVRFKKPKELSLKRPPKIPEASCSKEKSLNETTVKELSKSKLTSKLSTKKKTDAKTVLKNNVSIEDEEDDFQFIQKIEKKINQSSSHKNKKRKRLSNRNEFLLTQAVASGSDNSGYESADDDDDNDLESFIDDGSPHKMDYTDQHAFYLKSLKNCAGLPQKYKLKAFGNNSTVLEPGDGYSNYEFDSFCVNDDEVIFLSSDEELDCNTKHDYKKRYNKGKNPKKKLKRVIAFDHSTSSEHEVSPKLLKSVKDSSHTNNIQANPHEESIITVRKPKHRVLVSSDDEDEYTSVKLIKPEFNKKENVTVHPNNVQVESCSPKTSFDMADGNKLEFCIDFDDDIEFISEINMAVDQPFSKNTNPTNIKLLNTSEANTSKSSLPVPLVSKQMNSEVNEHAEISSVADVSFDIGWDEICPSTSSINEVPPLLLPTESTVVSNSLNNEREEAASIILVDSRELASGKPVISSLRNMHKLNPVVMQLPSSDYVISSHMAVERVLDSEFNSCSMPPKIIEKVKEMNEIYEKTILIIEKDNRKNVLSLNKKVTKYLQFVMHLNYQRGMKVLFSKSTDHTSDLIANLVQKERKRGFHINVPVALNARNKKLFDFYSTFPNINPVCALNFMYYFPNLEMLLKSSVEDLKKKGCISSQKAAKLYKYFRSELTFHD